jgi:hypothetical protein
MITSVTYHGDPGPSADETGRAPGERGTRRIR